MSDQPARVPVPTASCTRKVWPVHWLHSPPDGPEIWIERMHLTISKKETNPPHRLGGILLVGIVSRVHNKRRKGSQPPPVCLRRVHSPATQHQWGNQNHPGKQSSNLASYPCMMLYDLQHPSPAMGHCLMNNWPCSTKHLKSSLHIALGPFISLLNATQLTAGLRSWLHTLLPKEGSQMILPQESSSSFIMNYKKNRKKNMFHPKLPPHSCCCQYFPTLCFPSGEISMRSSDTSREQEPHCRDRCTTVIPLWVDDSGWVDGSQLWSEISKVKHIGTKFKHGSYHSVLDCNCWHIL